MLTDRQLAILKAAAERKAGVPYTILERIDQDVELLLRRGDIEPWGSTRMRATDKGRELLGHPNRSAPLVHVGRDDKVHFGK